MLIGAAATVAVLLLLQLLPDDNAREDVHKTVIVPGTVRWTDTGIDIDEGDVVTITASGEVFHSVELNQKVGPDGDPAKKYTSNIVTTSGHGSLIGKVGDEGPPFQVGTRNTFPSGRSGTFFLGINDAGVDNNRGRFLADVDVRRAE